MLWMMRSSSTPAVRGRRRATRTSDVARPRGSRSSVLFGTQKEKLRLYVGYPAPMRLARVVAYADVLRTRRRIAEEDTRTFWYRGQAVGTPERGVLPLRPGRHRYMSLRCRGHHLMLAALRRNAVVRCGLPGGVEFQVVGIPERGVIEVGEVAR